MPASLQQDFLFSFINDAVAFVSEGQGLGLQELYDWYRLGMAEDLLSQYNTITGISFNNVILTACHFDDIEMIDRFINTYHRKLQKEAKRWALAHLDYAKGDYDTGIDQLKDNLPKAAIFSIQVKLTLLKAYFKRLSVDTSQGKTFRHYCLSLEQYLNRKAPYSEKRNQSMLRYVQFAKKIAKLNELAPLEKKRMASL
ncbi:MAG: hypothetical protein AAGJ18_28335 [Bacteroidota bacterium]